MILSRPAVQILTALLVGWFLIAIVTMFPPPLLFGAVLATGYLLLFLVQPTWGLLLILLARSSTDLSVLLLPAASGIGGLVNVALVLILTAAGGLYILSRGVPLVSLPGGRLLALLLIAGLVGVVRSDDFVFAMNEWVPVLASFVIYALAAHLFADPKQARRAVDAIGLSFIVPAAFAVYQLLTGWTNFPRYPAVSSRLYSTFVHPNTFGFFLVVAIAVFLGQALFQVGKRKAAAVLGFCTALLLLVGTYARVAWAGALVVLLIVGLLRARVLLVLLPVGLLGAVGLVPSIAQRLADVPTGEGTLGHRLFTLWPSTLRAWLAATEGDGGLFVVAVNRLSGLGPGVGPALGRYGLQAIPHNDYLRVLVEYGIFGLILYLALFVVLAVAAYRAWRESRNTNPSAAAAALSFLALAVAFPVMSITDNIFAHTANQVYFWTLAGLTVAIRKWGRAESDQITVPRESPTSLTSRGSNVSAPSRGWGG